MLQRFAHGYKAPELDASGAVVKPGTPGSAHVTYDSMGKMLQSPRSGGGVVPHVTSGLGRAFITGAGSAALQALLRNTSTTAPLMRTLTGE